MKDVLYIIIPAYNEEENIGQLIKEWYPVIEKHNGGGCSRIVIIDDGSCDRTAEIASEESKSRPLLEIIKKKNAGHGSAVMYGYRTALKRGADYIFQTDSDRQTVPDEFEGFWRQRTRFDAVIGNRVSREDGIGRIVVTRILKLILFVICREYIPDANTPFRIIKADVLKDAMHYIEINEPLPNIMLCVILAKKKRRVLYKPVTFKKRQRGSNKINLKKIAVLGSEAVKRLQLLNARLK